MEQVDFENHFQKLPQFCPSNDMPQLFTSVSTASQGQLHEHVKQPQQESDLMKPSLDGSSLAITSNRQILDKRRSLVMQLFDQHGYYPPENITASFQQVHKDLFPSKWSLQVKIREVRQNIMKKQRFEIYIFLQSCILLPFVFKNICFASKIREVIYKESSSIFSF